MNVHGHIPVARVQLGQRWCDKYVLVLCERSVGLRRHADGYRADRVVIDIRNMLRSRALHVVSAGMVIVSYGEMLALRYNGPGAKYNTNGVHRPGFVMWVHPVRRPVIASVDLKQSPRQAVVVKAPVNRLKRTGRDQRQVAVQQPQAECRSLARTTTSSWSGALYRCFKATSTLLTGR